jgi:hypothetical protein
MLDATELPTILNARGRRLAEPMDHDCSNTGYDNAKRFDADEIVVHDLGHLSVLRWLLPQQDRCVLRGSLVGRWPATLSPLAGGKGRRP